MFLVFLLNWVHIVLKAYTIKNEQKFMIFDDKIFIQHFCMNNGKITKLENNTQILQIRNVKEKRLRLLVIQHKY